ncbi:YbaB/EbfC family nucleoid-associated protein [Spirochaeta dissipatitropha]
MNPMDMLKNLGQLQSKMGEAQEQLKKISVEGSAGGDLVKIRMNGEFRIMSVWISPEIIDPSDPEMLQDLILAAASAAQEKVKAAIQQNMSSFTGGMNLPPDLFNL